MELLEQLQHDFGEGPCLAAFAQDRVVAVEDLQSERVWDRLAAVVGQLQVRGVLSVPARLASQPVGTLDVYASQPRAWTPGEVEALGALAVVTAELASTGVELAVRDAEVAQTGLARRTAALDRARDDLDERERAADQRDRLPTDSE
jgi:GAF domain-containing protein